MTPINPRSFPSRRGFTLVEILVVVMILGIASAVIVPQLGSRDDLRVKAAARVLMSDLIYAQNMAISEQKTHYVIFSTAGKFYGIAENDVGSPWITHPVEKDDYRAQFEQDDTAFERVTLVESDFDGANEPDVEMIAFDPLGTPLYKDAATNSWQEMVTNGQVVLQSGIHTLTIQITPFTGEITVQ